MSISSSTVTLREITAANLFDIINLQTTAAQQRYIQPNAVSIAEAYFEPGGWFRGVYSGDIPVGFVMLFNPTIPGAMPTDPVEPTDMVLWRLMIDQRYQHQGLGRRTLDLVREHIVAIGGFTRLLSSFVPGLDGPEGFYLAYGFTKTGRTWTKGTETEIALAL